MLPANRLIARVRRPSGRTVLLVATGLLVAAGYLGLLAYEDHLAAERLAELRAQDPAAYLDRIRGRESFAAYMRDYAELRGYQTWRDPVPGFVAGRWALFEEPQEAGVAFEPEPCAPAVLFEDGALHLLGADTGKIPARYRIVGDTVQLRLDSGRTVDARVHGLESRIDHLSLDVPGLGQRYAYRCG